MNGHHLGLVKRCGILQTLDQVLHAAEYGAIFRHGGGYGRHWLLEVTGQVAAEVSDTALGAVGEGQRAFKT
ncbi:hypothetical protein D3C76_1548550 [compost metagenome]